MIILQFLYQTAFLMKIIILSNFSSFKNSLSMLPVVKHKDFSNQITRISKRVKNIQEVKTTFLEYIGQTQALYISFSEKLFKEMIQFQEKIVKTIFYASEKSNYILNMSKIYRQFCSTLEKTSKINLLNFERIKHEDITKQEEKLNSKCNLFLNQFQLYIKTEEEFNIVYMSYEKECQKFDEIIQKFQTYSNPLQFYNQTMTQDYLSQLEKKYNECANIETEVVTNIQILDQNRGFLTRSIKEVNQSYVILLHNHLVVMEKSINYVVDPKKQASHEQGKMFMRGSDQDSIENLHLTQLMRLDNILNSQNGKDDLQDDVFSDFSDLFRKSISTNEISSDYKFFYDRCENIRLKKLKTLDETINLQTTLISEMKILYQFYEEFQKSYTRIQKDIFKNNGIESFKKRFRKYYGGNYFESEELCLLIIQRPRRSLQKINKSILENQEKLTRLLEMKIENITSFEKRTKSILSQHLIIKDKVYGKNTNNSSTLDGELFSKFKANVYESLKQFKKQFKDLEANQKESDKMFFNQLKNYYQIILKENVSKNFNKILEKQKIRVNILKNLKIQNEIILILKEDSRYEMLINECPKPNLFENFISLVKRHEFEETKIILQKKQSRLKTMLRQKVNCCGTVKNQPINQGIIEKYECKLISKEEKIKGFLNILALGITFEEKSYNPFVDNIQIMIPQSDIKSYDVRNAENNQILDIVTDMGQLAFTTQSKNILEIKECMDKNIIFKIKDYGSEKDKNQKKKNDSSSFLKNNTSTEYKVSFDKTQDMKLNALYKDSKQIKSIDMSKSNFKLKKNDNQVLIDLIKKWKESKIVFFSQFFTPVQKQIPQSSQYIRNDYTYKNGHTKFYLKEKRQAKISGIVNFAFFEYEWKISFPENPQLHSFKHYETIRLELGSKDQAKASITEGKYSEQSLFIKHRFYKEVENMNRRIVTFMANLIEREIDVENKNQMDQTKSIESYNIVLDDIPFQDNKNFEKSESILTKGSKIIKNTANKFLNTNPSSTK